MARRTGDVVAPFDRDVEHGGAYQYTDGTRLSARIANERYTAMILSFADFNDARVVDVGSGDGAYTVELARHSGARSVLGIEPSEKAALRAAETYGDWAPRVAFRHASSADLLAEDLEFDIAVYRGVLHHVGDPREEIARAARLAPISIVLEPNGLNLLMKLVEKVSPYHREHGERSFTPRLMRRWFEQAGARLERFRFFGLVPYFCPDTVARLGKGLEPVVESVPGLRALACGQYVCAFARVQP